MSSTPRSGPKAAPPTPKAALRPITVEPDEHGRRIVHVPLAPAGVCRIEEADYARVIALGASPNWGLISTGEGSSRYVSVRTFFAGKSVAVARLVLEAPASSQVRFRGRDRADLRRSNIFLKDTAARGEGPERKDRVNGSGWVSIAKNPERITLRERLAAEKAEAEAAERAARAATSARVDRWRAWIAAKIAQGADPETTEAEGRAQCRAEARAYNEAHGLDANGYHPRPLARAKRAKGNARSIAPEAAPPTKVPASPAPEVIAALPFRGT